MRWYETVGLRTRLVCDLDLGLSLGLAGLVLCCETRSCHARRHNDLEGHSNFGGGRAGGRTVSDLTTASARAVFALFSFTY